MLFISQSSINILRIKHNRRSADKKSHPKCCYIAFFAVPALQNNNLLIGETQHIFIEFLKDFRG
jgi:hypothetical protein